CPPPKRISRLSLPASLEEFLSSGFSPRANQFLISAIQSTLSSIAITWSIELCSMCSRVIDLEPHSASELAILASKSARLFSLRGIWMISHLVKPLSNSCTLSTYLLIRSSFTSNSPLTCPTTSCESEC
ncbi:Unknown protein, partial [Striga hermonthica]